MKEAILMPEGNGFQEVKNNTNSATQKINGGFKICPSVMDRIVNNFNIKFPNFAVEKEK